SHPIAKIPLERLRAKNLRDWRDEYVIDEDEDPDAPRRSRQTANRYMASLKAALQHAFEEEMCETNAAWRDRGLMFARQAGKRRNYLTAPEKKKLVAACAPEISRFVRAALMLGARPGEIANATCADFDRQHGIVRLTGKTGPRNVSLAPAARELFAECT